MELPQVFGRVEVGRWDNLGFHSVGSRSDLPSWTLGGILAESIGRGVGISRTPELRFLEPRTSVSVSSPEVALMGEVSDM